MFPVVPLCVGLLAFLLIKHFLTVQKARHKLPPGPAPLPIIGNLGMLDFQIHHETLLKMASIYGDMYTLWLGRIPVVVLNGFQAVKEALIDRSEDFAERPISPSIEGLTGSEDGVLFSNGNVWKQQRRFTLMTLRNLGLGKRSLEDCIRQEANHLIQVFGQEKGRPLDPHRPIISAVTNVISFMLFGHRFSMEDETFHRLSEGFRTLTEFHSSYTARLYNAFPAAMKHLQPFLPRLLETMAHRKEIWRLIKEELEHHQRNRSPFEQPQDFIDSYLAHLEKNTREKEDDDPSTTFTESNMFQVVTDLFIAGSDTTTTALNWALLYMMAYPEIQEQVQEELDTVLGPSHVIHYKDREILPFTNAVLHETQRYSSISAIGVMHKCSKDTTLQGVPIHKGTIIFPNIFSVHYDPAHWETPRKFNPGHFLDKNGNFVKKEAFLAFSAGVRVCLGEKLARTMLFILFTSLLQAFRFQLPEGVKEINREPILGTSLQPHPYKACAIPR